MPVHVVSTTDGTPEAFIVCDKRSDINRVAVPITRLEQWQASGDSVASLLASLLDLHRSGASGTQAARWEVGMLKGAEYSSHLVLIANGKLTLSVAGHSIALADVLALEDNAFQVDRRTLNRLVDQPIAGAGDVESATQRRERVKTRVAELKAKGVKAFLKTVAKEEGVFVSRVKQLLKDDTGPGGSPRPGW